MPSKFITASAAILVSTFAFGATAQADDKVKFAYSAKELRSSDSVDSLYARIQKEAKKSCTKVAFRSLSFQQACRADLESDFVSAIDDRRLTATHHNKTSDDRYARK